jgi:hypothetical protein
MGATHDGIALILSPTLRSEEEIIAEMGDITLPAYALNLLEDLDYIHDKIPLRAESSSLDRPHFLIHPHHFSSPHPTGNTHVEIPQSRHLEEPRPFESRIVTSPTLC